MHNVVTTVMDLETYCSTWDRLFRFELVNKYATPLGYYRVGAFEGGIGSGMGSFGPTCFTA